MAIPNTHWPVTTRTASELAAKQGQGDSVDGKVRLIFTGAIFFLAESTFSLCAFLTQYHVNMS
jgi:hypothetical protein